VQRFEGWLVCKAHISLNSSFGSNKKEERRTRHQGSARTGAGPRARHNSTNTHNWVTGVRFHVALELDLFRASGFEVGVPGFGFRVSGFGFRASGSRDSGLRCRVSGSGVRLRASGFGVGVYDLACTDSGFRLKVSRFRFHVEKRFRFQVEGLEPRFLDFGFWGLNVEARNLVDALPRVLLHPSFGSSGLHAPP